MLADYCGSSRELERRDISCLLSDYPDYAPIDLFVDYYVLIYLSLSLVSSYGRMIVLVMMMVMVMMMLASDQRWAGLGWLAGETDPWLRDFSDIILAYTVVPACGGLGCECCLC